VNGLEFCYRTLVDHLGFAPDNVRVLNYDGSLRAFGDPEGEPCGTWRVDGTSYRMVVNAEGSREAFRHELGAIGEKLTLSDQLFINTTGHGGHHRGTDGVRIWSPILIASASGVAISVRISRPCRRTARWWC